MDEQDWLAAAIPLRTAHGRARTFGSLSVPRASLVELHELMLAAPPSVLDLFSQLPESVLQRVAALHRKQIEASCALDWPDPTDLGQFDGNPLGQWMFALAVQIRALDAELHELWSAAGGMQGALAWRCERQGHAPVFVVPRPRPRRRDEKPEGQGSYGRRGLLHHAVIPCRIGGDPVVLVREAAIPHQPAKNRPPLRLGAALSRDPPVDFVREPDGGFRIRDPVQASPGQLRLATEQLQAAETEGCFALVWPELTVPPDLRGHIQSWLLHRPHGAPAAPQLVVAGSWHEEVEGEVVNGASVFDRVGRLLLRYDKRLPYIAAPELGPEAIRRGDRMPVIITAEALVAIGICRDFCERGEAGSLGYPQLGVDLVIVPSAGNRATCEGHRDTARDTYFLRGGCSFVVQQAIPDKGEDPAKMPLGHVITCQSETSQQPAIHIQDTTWTLYKIWL